MRSVVVKGVVFRKNVANRRMSIKLFNPRVLLLAGALEYQRVSNQLSSLDTLLQQVHNRAIVGMNGHHAILLLYSYVMDCYPCCYIDWPPSSFEIEYSRLRHIALYKLSGVSGFCFALKAFVSDVYVGEAFEV